MSTEPMGDIEWLTVAEVAAKIRMSEEYVARQCHVGNLEAIKLGSVWRIEPAAVRRFMRSGRHDEASATGAAVVPSPRPGRSARQRRRTAS